MKKINFAYNEPRLGKIEMTEDMTEEDILKMIEDEFPEAIDVELLDVEELYG